ncbi:MAG: prepilin-type N-terminal cleavage/methylation domain-containing protein [Gemmatimonadales bacterium]
MGDACAVRGARFSPRAFTLVEVVVALALLGLLFGVSGLALASLRETPSAAIGRQLADARAEAIRTGRPAGVTVTIPDTAKYNAPRTTHLLFLPDGRAVGAGIDPLTGAALENP